MPDTPPVATDDKRLERIETLLNDGQKKASEDAAATTKWRADADVRLGRLEKATATQTVSVSNAKFQFSPIIRGLTAGWDGNERVRDEGVEALKTRDMSVTTASAGGYITPAVYRPELIDILTNQAVLTRAGVRQVTGLKGKSITLPKLVSGATFNYFEENPSAGVPSTQPVFTQVQVTPHQFGGKVVMSRLLAENADPAAEQVVRNIITRDAALFQDYTGLFGSGAGNEPGGLTAGSVPNSAINGAITLDKIHDMVTAVQSANGITNPATTGFIMTAREWGKLRKSKGSTNDHYIMAVDPTKGVTPTLLGFPVHVTNAIPENSSDNDETMVFFGDWSQLWHCVWSDIVVEVSTQGDYFDKHQVAVKLVGCDDWLCVNESSFYVYTDVRAA